MGEKNSSDNSQQVFRQFAWNLAGTLGKGGPRGARPGGSGGRGTGSGKAAVKR